MNKEEILQKLKRAATAYYNEEDSELTDEEYDSLNQFAEAQGWLKEDQKLNDNAEINLSEIVKHKVPMLSLKKAKTYEEIKKYYTDCLKAGANTFCVEPKLDGLALTIEFDNNTIKNISTRGTGREGENLSYLLNNKEITIKNLPESSSGLKEIRGELLCSTSDLLFNNESRGEDFKNERNAISGITKKAKLGLGYKAKITFLPYFGINKEDKLVLLKSKNQARYLFKNNIAHSYEELVEIIKKANTWRKEIGLPTDGIVIKPLEEISMGTTEHHPKEYIAFKYPTEQKTTIVKNIYYSIGKTGKLTPTVETEPVSIDGVTITSFTGNNIEWLNNRDVRIGSKVLVTRANDVIPVIIAAVDNSSAEEFKNIEYCPYCNTKLIGNKKSLKCPNINCSSRIQYKLENIVNKHNLDIDGLSSEYLKAIPKLKDVNDIISLQEKDLINIKSQSGVRLGEARANKIITQIKARKENCEEYRWLNSFNIEGIGTVTSKLILKEISLIDLYKDLNKSKEVLMNIKGIGAETIKNFENSFEVNKELLNKLLANGVVIHREEMADVEEKGIIVHTGAVPNRFKNRAELKDYLESLGYKLTSSVSKKTSYLLTEDKTSNSSKMKKAKELNIPILTFEEFINKNI